MAKKNDGGPAFPIPDPTENGDPGMSLRDHFAGLAMQAILGGICTIVGGTPNLAFDDEAAFLYAGIAYRAADAMLKARKS